MSQREQEKDFQSQVVELYQLLGWRVAFFHKVCHNGVWITPVGADGKGWLDLFICKESTGIALVRELKVPPNKATKEQEDWIRVMNACGIDAKVWTPDDWEEIELTAWM